MQARFSKPKQIHNYTHSAAVTGGQVIVVNGRCIVACADFAANTLGAYYFEGEFEFNKDNGDMTTIGAALYWNPVGNPLGGTAGTGAATLTSAGGTLMGFILETAGTTDSTVHGILTL